MQKSAFWKLNNILIRKKKKNFPFNYIYFPTWKFEQNMVYIIIELK